MTSRRCQSRIKANRSAYLDHGKPSTLPRKTLPFQLWNCHEAAKLCLSLPFACCRSIGAGFSSAQMETINLGKEIAFTQGFEGCMLEVLHVTIFLSRQTLPSVGADPGKGVQHPPTIFGRCCKLHSCCMILPGPALCLCLMHIVGEQSTAKTRS